MIDLRNFGLIGAIEFAPREGAPGARGFEVFRRAFEDGQMLTRVTGDVIALSPPLIVEKPHIDRIFNVLADVIRATG